MPEPTTPLAERPWETVERMLDVDTALARVLSAFRPLPAEEASLLDARGRVLADDVVAFNNVPPFRNSAMDGYAIRAADAAHATWEAPVALRVSARVAAGEGGAVSCPVGCAVRIMTGAPLPAGADAVVRFEETDEGRASATAGLNAVRIFRPPATGDNVREAGEDIAEGAVVAARGQTLGAAGLGLLASVGCVAVPIHRRPRVAILSTGDEVVSPDAALAPGKIRDSNAVVLAALARDWGAEVTMLGVARDTASDLTGRLDAGRNADLIVTSGGVSLGDYDVVKDVLRAEGEVAIWQVRMKPGKPLAFGRIGSTPLLGLPGNPAAAAISFLLFGRSAILRMAGHEEVGLPTIDVVTADCHDNRGQRRHFVRARLDRMQDGTIVARSVGEQGAGVLSALAAADALLVIPETLERVAAGTRLRAIPLQW
jgi:molybdopterin molybdotransferase